MQGQAAPLPIHRAYNIDWYIGIGLSFHYIFPILPLVLSFMVAFEGSYMN